MHQRPRTFLHLERIEKLDGFCNWRNVVYRHCLVYHIEEHCSLVVMSNCYWHQMMHQCKHECGAMTLNSFKMEHEFIELCKS